MTIRRGEPFTEWGYRIHYPMQREVAIVGERSGRMDGQQGREAALTRESVEDILRPLAEATDWEHTDNVRGWHVNPPPCPSCTPKAIPDPRFNALRRPIFASDYVTGPGIQGVLVDGRPWTLDASLGAIVRAAAACGLVVTWLSVGGTNSNSLAELQERPTPDGFSKRWVGGGDTIEEAAARALVAAWRADLPQAGQGGGAYE